MITDSVTDRSIARFELCDTEFISCYGSVSYLKMKNMPKKCHLYNLFKGQHHLKVTFMDQFTVEKVNPPPLLFGSSSKYF